MKKISLLAVSVAVALTGCGGSDSDSSPSSPTTRTITGMDGYFNQAVVFVDKNDNGVLDIESEEILGLTDHKGQLSIPVGTTGTLAMQTIIPGGAVQTALINKDHTYAGKYTIDMDHPTQAMAHEVVFRARSGSGVVTPLTDLVMIKASNANMTEDEAEVEIRKALGLEEGANLYIDFVDGDNADIKLHKTAQILTESKAANKDNTDYIDNVVEIAKKATEYVAGTDSDKLKDPNYRPIITGDSSGGTFVPAVVTNTKLLVDKTFFDDIQDKLDETNPTKDESFFHQFELTDEDSALFSDADQTDGVEVKLRSNTAWETFGLTVTIDESMVTIESDNLLSGGSVDIMIAGIDRNSANNEVSQVVTHFTLDITTPNTPPTVDANVQKTIQDEISSWSWQQGSAIQDSTDITNLFNDEDGDDLTITADLINADGITVNISDNNNLVFTGTPTTVTDGLKLTLTAKDKESDISADFTLPNIEEGQAPTPPVTGNPLHNNTWYVLAVESFNNNGVEDYLVTCSLFKLDNNKLYFTNNNKKRATECPLESDINTSQSMNYTVTDDNTINVDNGSLEWQIDTSTPGNDISIGAVTVVEKEDDNYERFTFFKNKADAEKRIDLESGDQPEHRVFNMWLPTTGDTMYSLGTVSVQIQQDDSYQFDADIFFDVPNTDFTCDELFDFYDEFKFTGDNITTITADRNNCHDNEENGVKYVGIDFDLSRTQLNYPDVYSILGLLQSDEAEYLEAVSLNIKWTSSSD